MFRCLLASGLLLVSLSSTAAASFQHVTAQRMVAVARARIDAQLGDARGTAQVTVVGTPEDVVVSSGAIALKAGELKGKWPRARVGVPVIVEVDGQTVRSATVWFALSVPGPVLAYASDAPLGKTAASLKFVPRSADVAQVQGDLVRDPQDVAGMRLRHAVTADAVAIREDFERVPDVDRQQRVQVSVAYGSIHLEGRGIATGQGSVGDVVSVLVDGAETPVRARITDKGAVEVVQ